MSTDAIPDDILVLIFLRLDSPVCLHAASACKQWRRVVTDANFLCRFFSLHGPPPVAGVYYQRPCHPRNRPDFIGSPWVDVDSRFFSLYFLPDSELSSWAWRIQDSRGSLLLFDRLRHPQGSAPYGHAVVCEPLTRRYVMLDPLSRFKGYSILNACLVDGETGGIGIENFRVVFRLHTRHIIHTTAGMATMGRDRQQSWRKISIDELMNRAGPSDNLIPGSVYWFNLGRNVAALDRRTGEFSSVLLPEVDDWDFHKEVYDFTVTSGHDGTVRILLSRSDGELMVFSRLQQRGGEWALARRIRLSAAVRDLPGCDPSFFVGEAALICTDGTPVILLSPWRKTKCWFHLDIDTMAVAPAPDPDVAQAFPCRLPWPPTLHACTGCVELDA